MRSSKYIQSQFSFFFSNKDRYGLFDNNTSSDVRYALILLSQTVLFSGFCLYDFFSTYDKFLFASVPHVYLLLLFIIVIALFILIKWAVYMFINWIFFYKTKQKLWISSFSSVPFVANKIEYNDPRILADFNTITRRFNPYIKDGLLAPINQPEYNFCGRPYVLQYNGAYRLVWYYSVDEEPRDGFPYMVEQAKKEMATNQPVPIEGECI
jgi:hypothetical protein